MPEFGLVMQQGGGSYKYGWLGVLSYLAPFTLLAPALNILVHTRPITSLPHQPYSPFGTLVAMLVVQLVQSLTHHGRGQDQLENLLTIGGEDLAMKHTILLYNSIPLFVPQCKGFLGTLVMFTCIWCLPSYPEHQEVVASAFCRTRRLE